MTDAERLITAYKQVRSAPNLLAIAMAGGRLVASHDGESYFYMSDGSHLALVERDGYCGVQFLPAHATGR